MLVQTNRSTHTVFTIANSVMQHCKSSILSHHTNGVPEADIVMPEVATTACSRELLALVQQTVAVLRLQRLLKLHLMP